MADEHVREPDRYAPGTVPNLPGGNRNGGMPPPAAPPTQDERSAVVAFLCWMAGMLLVFNAGWGLIFVVGYYASRWQIGLPWEAAAGIAAFLSLVLFLLLERNMWLTRFMGLSTWTPSPVAEAVLLWFLGIPGLLVRSTSTHPTPQPQASHEGPQPPFPDDEHVRAGSPGEAQPLFLPRAPRHPVHEEKDTFREIVETVVFVVVLVLMLRAFVAEAFVIPTGSMATTLLGYHRNVTCPECGHSFEVNASKEADAQEQFPQQVTGCVCPNCRLPIEFRVQPPQGAFP